CAFFCCAYPRLTPVIQADDVVTSGSDYFSEVVDGSHNVMRFHVPAKIVVLAHREYSRMRAATRSDEIVDVLKVPMISCDQNAISCHGISELYDITLTQLTNLTRETNVVACFP